MISNIKQLTIQIRLNWMERMRKGGRRPSFFHIIMWMFFTVYLILMGWSAPFIIQESHLNHTPLQLLYGGMGFIFLFDFMMCFHNFTPIHNKLQPFQLLPIKKQQIALALALEPFQDVLLNWALIPIASYLFFYGKDEWGTFLCGGILLSWIVLLMLNRCIIQLYQLCVLCTWKSYLIPILLYSTLTVSVFTPQPFNIIMPLWHWGEQLMKFQPLAYIPLLLMSALIPALCHKVALRLLSTEAVNLQEQNAYNNKSLHTHSNRTSTYLQLTVLEITRCKDVSRIVVHTLIASAIIAVLRGFTTVYQSSVEHTFVYYFCFECLPINLLPYLFQLENNSIEGTLTRRTPFKQIIKSKYYVCCLFLAIPGVLLSPAFYQEGVDGIPAFLSAILFTTGPAAWLITYWSCAHPLPLEKNGDASHRKMERLFLSVLCLCPPIVMDHLLTLTVGRTMALWTMTLLGALITLLHPWWIKQTATIWKKHRHEWTAVAHLQ